MNSGRAIIHLACLLLLAAQAAAESVTVAGVTLELPAGLVADKRPPAGTLAAWRSEDGSAGIAVVEREPFVDPDWREAQAAALAELAQGFELLHAGEHPADSGWYQLRYRLDLGPLRFEQDARIAQLPQPQGRRSVVVTASWPVDAAQTWGAALTASLDGLATPPPE